MTQSFSDKKVAYVEQTGFLYFECQECGFDSVQLFTYTGPEECPLCAGDSGHSNIMTKRVARNTDDPEGLDARVGIKR